MFVLWLLLGKSGSKDNALFRLILEKRIEKLYRRTQHHRRQKRYCGECVCLFLRLLLYLFTLSEDDFSPHFGWGYLGFWFWCFSIFVNLWPCKLSYYSKSFFSFDFLFCHSLSCCLSFLSVFDILLKASSFDFFKLFTHVTLVGLTSSFAEFLCIRRKCMDSPDTTCLLKNRFGRNFRLQIGFNSLKSGIKMIWITVKFTVANTSHNSYFHCKISSGALSSIVVRKSKVNESWIPFRKTFTMFWPGRFLDEGYGIPLKWPLTFRSSISLLCFFVHLHICT